MFYERLRNVCDSKGITVTSLLKSLNISTSKGTAWKNGSSPNGEIVKQIASYLDVSTDYLLGNEQKENAPSQYSDEALRAYNIFALLSKEDKELIMRMMDKMIDK